MLAGGLMLVRKFSILRSAEKFSPRLASSDPRQSLASRPFLDDQLLDDQLLHYQLLDNQLLDMNRMAILKRAANHTRVIFVMTANVDSAKF